MLSAKQNEYCIYRHTNKVNGKVYIGLTKQKPERRWQKGHGYIGTLFGNAIGKYGWDNFEHEIVAEGLTRSRYLSGVRSDSSGRRWSYGFE